MGKSPRSFSIDEDIKEILTKREDLNASAAVNRFLREYISSGQGEEAALQVRLEQLDDEIAEAQKELEQLKRERERIQGHLQSREENLRDVLFDVETKLKAGEFPRENLEPDNPAVQNWASKAGVQPDRFVDELEARL